MSTEEKTSQLIINKLTKEQFEAIETPSETELYLTPDESIQAGDNVSVLVNDAGYQTASDVEAAVSGKIAGKQDTITDLDTIRSGAALGATALQTYTETDPTVPAHVKAITAENITTWNNKSSFSGNYEDLTNKPTIPTVPTVVSAFENDAGYVTNEYHDNTKQDVIEDLSEIRTSIANIKSVIPEQATVDNKLADKAFVNSSIATSTANFKGTFDSLEELQAVENPTSNDYAFLKETDATGNVSYSRYKYNGTSWVFEFKVNNSSFTEAQWAAIGSGVTSDKITGYDAHIANEGIHVTAEQKTSWTAKQDAIEDLATIRSGAALGATALQSYTESDPTVPAHVKAITEENITTWNNKSSFSGSYEDLTNKPTIPTVNNNTIVIKQGDKIKGTFTLNQGEDYTIELDAGGSGTTAASQFGEINGITTISTTELDLGRTIKKSQMVGLNVGNTLVLPELYSLSTDGTKIILQNAIGANVMWSVVYVKALNVAELQEATSETFGVVKIDSTPTAGSTNAITSGAVYAALQEIKNTLSQLNSGN